MIISRIRLGYSVKQIFALSFIMLNNIIKIYCLNDLIMDNMREAEGRKDCKYGTDFDLRKVIRVNSRNFLALSKRKIAIFEYFKFFFIYKHIT